MMKKGCSGSIQIEIYPEQELIDYLCSECRNGGTIVGWHGTKWDNLKEAENIR